MNITNNNKKAYATIALIALAGVGYWYYTKRKEEQQDNDQDSNLFDLPPLTASYTPSKPKPTRVTKPTGGYTPPSGKFRCTSKSYPLAHGTCHNDVKIVQAYLKKTFGASLGNSGKNRNGVDGMFGTKTAAAAHRHLGKIFFTQKDISGMRDANKMILV